MPSITDMATIMDKGIVTFLFVLVFVYFVYRGIPAVVDLAKEILYKINAEHTHQINTITASFETALDTITSKFIAQIERQHEESEKYHKEHGEKIEEIYNALKQKSTSLKPKKNAS